MEAAEVDAEAAPAATVGSSLLPQAPTASPVAGTDTDTIFVSRLKTLLTKRLLVSLVLGQGLSFCICGSALTSGLLTGYGFNAPTLQSFINYLSLALLYGSYCVYRRAGVSLWKVLRANGWLYLLAAIADVEANYLIVKAYQYTSVTSVQLLDCLTIPTVVVISIFYFRVRFRVNHWMGVLISLIGVGGMIFADGITRKEGNNAPSNALLGDALVAIGALLYGVSNCFQEELIRRESKIDYIGFLALFAAPISGLQLLILEREEIRDIRIFSAETLACLLGFSFCMFILYSCMPFVMEMSSAVIVNLSLLTADLYALFLGLAVFKYTFHLLYFFAYVAIMIGVVVYVIREPLYHAPALPGTVGDPETPAVLTAKTETLEIAENPETDPVDEGILMGMNSLTLSR